MSALIKNRYTEALLGEQLDVFTFVAGVAITAIAWFTRQAAGARLRCRFPTPPKL